MLKPKVVIIRQDAGRFASQREGPGRCEAKTKRILLQDWALGGIHGCDLVALVAMRGTRQKSVVKPQDTLGRRREPPGFGTGVFRKIALLEGYLVPLWGLL